MTLARLSPWALLFVVPDLAAAWVGVCTAAPEQAAIKVLESARAPSGASSALVVADIPLPGCAMRELPLTKEGIAWGRVMNRGRTPSLAGGVILKGVEAQGRFTVNEVISLSEPDPGPGSLPVGENLVSRLKATAFGKEGRAVVRMTGSRAVIDCSAGQLPAGALIRSDGAKLPEGASLALRVGADADAPFHLGAVDAGHDGRGEPLALGAISPGISQPLFPLPASLDTATWRSWAVSCPTSDARLEIRSMHLEPHSTSRDVPARALWIWRPEAWSTRPEELLRQLAASHAATVFVTVPLTAGGERVADPEALGSFIARASGRGVRVWAVAGDPRAVLPAERAAYAARARAYAAYNRASPPEARLAGLQLDIEPYLNTGYDVDPEPWLSAYLETLVLVKPAAGMPLDVAVPFWWGRQSYRGGRLLDHLAPIIDVLTVMDYRTDRRQILQFAEPFLAWGTRAGRGVRIGLEAGPLPDETMRVFRKAEKGTLWLVTNGGHAYLLLLDAPADNPAGISFAYSHSVPWRSSSVTFRQDLGALRELLPELERALQAWPAFSGVALHGLDSDGGDGAADAKRSDQKR